MPSGNKLSNYFWYAIGEVILIVLGILVALKINNWNIEQLNHSAEMVIYEGIRHQIRQDQHKLIEIKDLNTSYSKQFAKARELISTKNMAAKDTLAYFTMNLSQYSDFHRRSNVYETLVNSGDLKLIRNAHIPGLIQELEMTYNHINRLEEIQWDIIVNELSPEIKGVINY